MILRIFKKDLQLLWKTALAVALSQWVVIACVVWQTDATGPLLLSVASPVPFMAAFYLLVALVHSDNVTSDRQDWLIRPIPRWHLLAAKLLFTAVAVVGPVLVADLLFGVALGFSTGVIVPAAFLHATILFCMALPVLGIATFTANLGEAVVAGILMLTAVLLAQTLIGDTTSMPHSVHYFWLIGFGLLAAVFLASAAIVTFQYFLRRTVWARAMAVTLAVLCVLSTNGSIAAASKLERQRLDRESSKQFRVTFVPERGNFRPESLRKYDNYSSAVHVPVSIEGLSGSQDFAVAVNYIRLRIQYPSGEWVESEATPVFVANTTLGFRYQTFFFEKKSVWQDYGALEGRAVIDFSLLRLRPRTAEIAVGQPRRQIEDLGLCDAVARQGYRSVHCLSAGRSQFAPGLRSRSPGYLEPLPGEVFRFMSGDIAGEMDAVHMTTYKLESEHTVRLEIPKFRINDWR